MNSPYIVSGFVWKSSSSSTYYSENSNLILWRNVSVSTGRCVVETITWENFKNVREFLDGINRGGLRLPSILAFAACIKAWLAYQAIIRYTDTRTVFLSSGVRQQELFVRTVKCRCCGKTANWKRFQSQLSVAKLVTSQSKVLWVGFLTAWWAIWSNNIIGRWEG